MHLLTTPGWRARYSSGWPKLPAPPSQMANSPSTSMMGCLSTNSKAFDRCLPNAYWLVEDSKLIMWEYQMESNKKQNVGYELIKVVLSHISSFTCTYDGILLTEAIFGRINANFSGTHESWGITCKNSKDRCCFCPDCWWNHHCQGPTTNWHNVGIFFQRSPWGYEFWISCTWQLEFSFTTHSILCHKIQV